MYQQICSSHYLESLIVSVLCTFQANHNWLKSLRGMLWGCHILSYSVSRSADWRIWWGQSYIDCLNHTLIMHFELRPSDQCYKVPELSCKNIVCSVLTFWSHPMYKSHISFLKLELMAGALNDMCYHLPVNSTVIFNQPMCHFGGSSVKNRLKY